jgi:hypothetical protein
MPALTTALPGWARALQPGDLAIIGLDGDPADYLGELAEGDDVDLDNVTRCLALLKAQPLLLHMGLPLALLIYWPARGCYSASFDGECAPDLDQLTEAQAGLWLATLAAEIGPLPEAEPHWALLRAQGRQLSGEQREAIAAYQALIDPPEDALDGVPPDYDRLIARAVWTLAARCQDGR